MTETVEVDDEGLEEIDVTDELTVEVVL